MQAQQQYQQALAHYQQGKPQQAIEMLLPLRNQAVNIPGFWGLLGACYEGIAQINTAAQYYRSAIAAEPRNSQWPNRYAGVLIKLGQPAEAERHYRSALQMDQNNSQLWLNLAMLYFRQRLVNPSIEVLEHVLTLKPDFERAQELLMQALGVRGKDDDFERAEAIAKKILASNPIAQRALLFLAEMYWLQGRDDWDAGYQSALTDHPGQTALLSDYLRKLVEADQTDKAQAQLKLLDNGKSDLERVLLRVFVAQAAQEHQKALEELNKVTAQLQKHRSVLRARVASCLALKQYAEALTAAENLISWGNAPQGDWALLATCHKKIGNWDKYRTLYDFDQFVWMNEIEVPKGYNSLADFNKALNDVLMKQHRDKRHPLAQSLRLGSQTAGHLFHVDEKPIRELEVALTNALKRYVKRLKKTPGHPFLTRYGEDFLFTGAWSVRLNNQGFHRNHFHNEGWISGCYYIDIPQEVNRNGQGWIQFGQFEGHGSDVDEPDYIVKPQAGHTVLFPSYMWHGTRPFLAEAFRVTVAFDVVPREVAQS